MSNFINTIIDYFVHLDKNLAALTSHYGSLTYGLLFAVVFAETGFVVTPFLPGDSLLFAAGAIAATGGLDIVTLCVVLIVAAVAGVQCNYHIGRYVGPRVFRRTSGRFLRRDYLVSAQKFCDRYGTKAIFLSRFVPIVRTCAPFVVGVGQLDYLKFTAINVTSGIFWVLLFTLGGYFFGRLPFVRDNFSLVIIAIIVVTIVPLVVETIRVKRPGKA